MDEKDTECGCARARTPHEHYGAGKCQRITYHCAVVRPGASTDELTFADAETCGCGWLEAELAEAREEIAKLAATTTDARVALAEAQARIAYERARRAEAEVARLKERIR